MVAGAVHGPPYLTVASLLDAAAAQWPTLSARLALAGHADPLGWPARLFVDVIWTMAMDAQPDETARLAFAARLTGHSLQEQAEADGWGVLTEAEAARILTADPTTGTPGG